MTLKLDRIDINILAKLQQNSGLTNVELSDLVGLSPSPCLKRVRRLEKLGYITSYNAQINLGKLTDYIIVFTEISLSDHGKEDFLRFEAAIAKCLNVQECHLIGGKFDYLIKFVSPSIQHYQEMMESFLDGDIGVAKYASNVVVKPVTFRPSVPIEEIMSGTPFSPET